MKQIEIIVIGLVLLNLIVNLFILLNNNKNTDNSNEDKENYCGCKNSYDSYNNNVYKRNMSVYQTITCNPYLIGSWQASSGNGNSLNFNKDGTVINQNKGQSGVLYMYNCEENNGTIYNQDKTMSISFFIDQLKLYIEDPERGRVEYTKVQNVPTYTPTMSPINKFFN